MLFIPNLGLLIAASPIGKEMAASYQSPEFIRNNFKVVGTKLVDPRFVEDAKTRAETNKQLGKWRGYFDGILAKYT